MKKKDIGKITQEFVDSCIDYKKMYQDLQKETAEKVQKLKEDEIKFLIFIKKEIVAIINEESQGVQDYTDEFVITPIIKRLSQLQKQKEEKV